jgi:acetylglutamate kinase
VQEAIRKASVLIEAMSWIRRFRDRYVVVKLGGSALEEREAVNSLLTDVMFMETVGMKPILVHGGGKAINRAMATAGIEPRFVEGRRYTDDTTLGIVSRTLANEISSSLVEEIERQGGHAKALHFGSDNCLHGERLTLTGRTGEPVDLGRVGKVTSVDTELLAKTLSDGRIPVIPSVAIDVDGSLLNVNADTAAAAVATFLNAEKLVFLTDIPGICSDRDEESTLISHLDTASCQQLISDGIIDSGMVPKVDAALAALAAGVRKVHIVDGRMQHSVLLEIYSDKGVGTEIVA